MNFKEIIQKSKKRIITAIVLMLIVALIALVDNFFLTWIFLGVVFIFAFYEAMRLFEIENNLLYSYAVALWLLALLYPNPDDLIFVVLILFVSVMVYTQKVDFKLIYPFMYPASSFLFLLALYHDFGMNAIIWLVLIVASTDIGAYFVGKSVGKTKFSKASPNKTLEGVAGGVAIGGALGSVFGLMFVSFWLSLAVSVLVSISSVFGDLFESFLKRKAGVKDSGNILPGHGGVLDRVDGYMFASVLMVILLRGLS
jgi:phosphatidate cytidylyltransferase